MLYLAAIVMNSRFEDVPLQKFIRRYPVLSFTNS